jgi:hypothetical protein
MQAGGVRRAQGRDRPRRQDGVLGDQRAVEVAGERLDLCREVVGEGQLFCVRNATSASTSSGDSVLKLGITFGW